jgi:hypothetical protein
VCLAASDTGLQQETGDSKVAELAHQVCIKEDVAWLEVSMHNWVRLVLVKENQCGANLRYDLDAHLPTEWPGVVNTVQTIFQASIR